MGYNDRHKGYWYFSPTTNKFHVSRHVVFDESSLPYKNSGQAMQLTIFCATHHQPLQTYQFTKFSSGNPPTLSLVKGGKPWILELCWKNSTRTINLAQYSGESRTLSIGSLGINKDNVDFETLVGSLFSLLLLLTRCLCLVFSNLLGSFWRPHAKSEGISPTSKK